VAGEATFNNLNNSGCRWRASRGSNGIRERSHADPRHADRRSGEATDVSRSHGRVRGLTLLLGFTRLLGFAL